VQAALRQTSGAPARDGQRSAQRRGRGIGGPEARGGGGRVSAQPRGLSEEQSRAAGRSGALIAASPCHGGRAGAMKAAAGGGGGGGGGGAKAGGRAPAAAGGDGGAAAGGKARRKGKEAQDAAAAPTPGDGVPAEPVDYTKLYAVPDCPVFYPTAKEFNHPGKYIESISEQVRRGVQCRPRCACAGAA
jgi:hypothetical protein